MNKENINKRLRMEIENLDADSEIKKFLEELLMEESCGTLKHSYKEYYKKLINKHVDEKLK